MAFDQMSMSGWKLAWLGLEVGDLGDLVIVSGIDEAQAGLRAFSPADLGPAGCVLTAARDPAGPAGSQPGEVGVGVCSSCGAGSWFR
ncbi:MAG TPA: hypothetical protein VLW50_26640 [Streptosporangiaceae bacterium]|nr:hypothetical protein [Streptosporangiaceae bacterium]